MNLLQALGRAIRIPELRRKILVMVGLLLVCRVLAGISIPYANHNALVSEVGSGGGFLNVLNLFSGGGLGSLVSMGLNPYINATIIMQLMTVVSVRLKELAKEGEQGRKKITRYSRWLTVALGALQAYGLTVYFENTQVQNQYLLDPTTTTPAEIIALILIMTAATVVLMWIGELITEYGIGNGVSLVIFAGIIGRLPGTIITQAQSNNGNGSGLIPLIVMALAAVVVTAFIIEVQQARRKIPVQSAQRILNPRTGAATASRSNFLPLQLNAAGVIPIIFALSILQFPSIFGNLFQNATGVVGNVAKWFQTNWVASGPGAGFNFANVVYNAVYFLLIFMFTYFYTSVVFNPDDVADDFKKNSTFIPGIRPGPNTARYLSQVMHRITLAGALFLAIIAVAVPVGAGAVSGISRGNTGLYLGGTAVLIAVGVALDTMKQIETQLQMRQYRGFIK